MMQRLLMTRRNMLFSLVGIVMTTMLTLWGCGGGGGTSSYTDPSPTTIKSATVISASTLKQWIDEGKLNAPLGSKDRVVIVSPSTSANWVLTTKGHIPGAVRWGTDETSKSRVEGLALAVYMMPDGPMMDSIVQRLGIDGNTTVVVSLPKNSSLYDQSLIYWDLRYWGFPRDRVKILNGGDDAWEVAGYTLSVDATEKYTASTYSVNKNTALNDTFRFSLGEMIDKVDTLIADPTQKDNWQLLEVRGTATTPYITNALRQTSATMFLTRLDAGDGVTRNYIYPDKATLEARMATLAVKDGSVDAFVSPTKKTIAMCGASTSASPTFVLFDAVLGVAEGNIALYDGSATQWNNYSLERLTLAYPTMESKYLTPWAFNNTTAPRAQGAMLTTAVPSIWSVVPILGYSDPAMNQIESADKLYMTPAATTPSTGTSSGGSAPSGC